MMKKDVISEYLGAATGVAEQDIRARDVQEHGDEFALDVLKDTIETAREILPDVVRAARDTDNSRLYDSVAHTLATIGQLTSQYMRIKGEDAPSVNNNNNAVFVGSTEALLAALKGGNLLQEGV